MANIVHPAVNPGVTPLWQDADFIRTRKGDLIVACVPTAANGNRGRLCLSRYDGSSPPEPGPLETFEAESVMGCSLGERPSGLLDLWYIVPTAIRYRESRDGGATWGDPTDVTFPELLQAPALSISYGLNPALPNTSQRQIAHLHNPARRVMHLLFWAAKVYPTANQDGHYHAVAEYSSGGGLAFRPNPFRTDNQAPALSSPGRPQARRSGHFMCGGRHNAYALRGAGNEIVMVELVNIGSGVQPRRLDRTETLLIVMSRPDILTDSIWLAGTLKYTRDPYPSLPQLVWDLPGNAGGDIVGSASAPSCLKQRRHGEWEFLYRTNANELAFVRHRNLNPGVSSPWT